LRLRDDKADDEKRGAADPCDRRCAHREPEKKFRKVKGYPDMEVFLCKLKLAGVDSTGGGGVRCAKSIAA
jgi:hypothetical protein